MLFAYWQNKAKPSMERVYINGLVTEDKVWLEQDKNGGYRVAGIHQHGPIAEKVAEYARENELQTFADFVAHAKMGDKASRRKASTYNQYQKKDKSSEERKSNGDDIADLATIKVPEPVLIRVDHREPIEIVNYLSGLPNVEVSVEALDLGDFVLNDEIIIERKMCNQEADTRNDFEQSIMGDDKRFFNQSERLKFEGDKIAIVLLEGDVYRNSARMLTQQIDGALSFLVSIQRLSLLHTYNMKHTAYLLLKLATHHKSGLGYDLGLRSKKPETLIDQRAFVLEGLPGVNAALARRLLEHFGSVAAVMNATERDLLEVPGLGKKKVEAIVSVIR